MNRLLLLWSAVMMVLAVLVVLAAVLQCVGTVMLLTGMVPGGTQPGEPSRLTLAFHLMLEVLFMGLGIWLFRFARRLRRALRAKDA